MTLYDLGVITPQGNSIIKTFVYDSKASVADNVHKALDIAGFIPGIGSFSEGANSLLYAFQGEKGEAALAALSAIPGIKAVKVLKDGIQYLKIIPESREAGKALKELYDVEKTAGNIGHVIEVTAEPGKATRDVLLENVTNQKLKNAIDQIYRHGASVGDGGLADAIKHELTTGQLVGGKSHIQKGIERIKNLENILGKENLSRVDREIAKKLLHDLKDALKGAIL